MHHWTFLTVILVFSIVLGAVGRLLIYFENKKPPEKK